MAEDNLLEYGVSPVVQAIAIGWLLVAPNNLCFLGASCVHPRRFAITGRYILVARTYRSDALNRR